VFEVTFGDLRNPAAHKALRKLATAEKFPDAKAAYRAAKLIRVFDQESKLCDQVFVGLLKQEGIPIKADGTYEVSDADIEGWRAKYDDFCKTAASLNAFKLSVDDLPPGMTPIEIMAIDAMIDQ